MGTFYEKNTSVSDISRRVRRPSPRLAISDMINTNKVFSTIRACPDPFDHSPLTGGQSLTTEPFL